MADIAKRFEILILRPLHILFLVSAVFFLVKGMWWWLAGCAVGIIYLGIVGSKLHPFQSASDLAQGPIEGPAARIESELLPQEVKQMLVGHACTRVGILVGVAVGVISLSVFGWRWYFALLIGCIIMLISGSLLKLVLKTI
jgi:MFS family permease